MVRRILSLLLIISGLAIGLMASAFYLLNSPPDPLVGVEQQIEQPSATIKPQRLTATFIGTSTLLFSDGESSIMIDGFFTRPPINTLLWGSIEPDIPQIKSSLKRLNVTTLNGIMVVHSHHDHVMDAPEVAKLTQATLFGSESTANIARSAGLPEPQIEIVDDQRSLILGQFNVTMIKSKHTPVPSVLAWLTGHGQDISSPFPLKPKLTDFNEGGSYVVHIAHPLGNILVQASGGYVKGRLQGFQADVVYLGVAGLSKQSEQFKQDYFHETVATVGAKTVIPIHWDNFMRPIGQALVPPHSAIDNTPQSITELSDYIEHEAKGSLIVMQAWDTITLY
ncbi:MBL fold metallo-hydrolase [Alkalimarinus sediminis]|uniref:MBL fold metallo-hydrolase n=1 Tax=Alkalimarinus sediminis TaxID=1632866 RepID=A0A9E8HLM5_9ALTE|nr:MBL fold metallo-hydrolase [Alkalimarinus sediminis]UZW75136.1 MBL fold metallo-hydrolase [Alkalimarinus sediminis]